jgi:hypothetical protein
MTILLGRPNQDEMGRVCSMGGREETPNDIAFLKIHVHAE